MTPQKFLVNYPSITVNINSPTPIWSCYEVDRFFFFNSITNKFSKKFDDTYEFLDQYQSERFFDFSLVLLDENVYIIDKNFNLYKTKTSSYKLDYYDYKFYPQSNMHLLVLENDLLLIRVKKNNTLFISQAVENKI